MRREAVDSDAIRSIGYNPARRVQQVQFHSSAIYDYLDVPGDVHLEVMQADSVGEAFSRCVRNAGFEYRLVREPGPTPERAEAGGT